jgi:ABC-type transporter Mla subunit MlaD
MNQIFLEKLFPFGYLFSSFDKALSAWWVLLTIIYALTSGIILFQQTRQIKNALKTLPETPTPEQIQKIPLLKDSWQDYVDTFFASSGEFQKTNEDSLYYFNENSVLSQKLSLRYWYSVPNILVGFGILGTFVGLTFGIADFKTGSTPEIKASINILLSGMGLAFVTSIWGMLLSMGFNILEKNLFSQVNKEIRAFCKKLDRTFKFTRKDLLRQEQQERQELLEQFSQRYQQLLENYFVFQTEEQKPVLPAYVLRDLLMQSEQQTKALKSFSSDLADGIMIANQTIESMGQTFADMIEVPFRQQFTPAIEKIEAAVNQLRNAKEESSGNMIQEVLGNLQNTLLQVSQDFQQSLSGSARESLENLAQVVGQAGNSLLSFPEKMDTVMQAMQTQSDQLKSQMTQFSETMQTQAEDNARRLREDTSATAQSLHDVISGLQDKMQGLIKEQAAGTQTVQQVVLSSREILQNGKELMGQMGQTLGSFDQAYKQLNSLSDQMISTSQNLYESSHSLQTSSQQFGTQAQSFLEGNRQTLGQIEAALEEARVTAQDYSSRFQVIQSGLSQIFGEVEQGLQRYQSTTREKLNDALSAFSQELSQAISYLSGGVRELNEVVEEISDMRGKV